jgi:DNA-binding Lrp family transcriptional regulator
MYVSFDNEWGFLKSDEIEKEIIMVTSIILANVERSKINETAEQLAAIDGISEVYSVSGNYDLIAVVRVQSNDELSDLVTKKLLKINSILKTETMLAFKAYSRHDLEAIFSIGT